MKRYFYFRDVADEINDDDNSSSLMLPVENITAIAPHNSTTTLNILFTSSSVRCLPYVGEELA